MAITPIHEQSFSQPFIGNDISLENVPQYTFSEIYDVVLDESFVSEHADEENGESLIDECEPLKVKLFTTGIPLIKDLPKRKRKKGH